MQGKNKAESPSLKAFRFFDSILFFKPFLHPAQECRPTAILLKKMTSFMIRMPMDNPESSVNLFDQHKPHELVRVGEFAKGNVLVGAGEDGLAEAERAADDEDDVAFAGGAEFVDFIGELYGIVLLALDGHREDVALFRDFGEDLFAFFVLDQFHLFIAQVFGRFFVPDFDDLQLAVAAEPLCVFGDALLQIFLLQFSHRNDFYVHCFSLLFLLNYYPMGTSAISQPSFFNGFLTEIYL